MTVDEARIARLERQLDAALALIDRQAQQLEVLGDRCKRLEEENADLRRKLAQNSSNSSKPPSSDSPRDRAARRGASPTGGSRGAQPGHKPKKRELVPVKELNSVTECFPEHCRGCARGLPKRRDPEPRRHQVWDLPEIKPIVDEYRLHRTKCDVCGKTTCAAPPAGVPKGAFGPGVLSLATLLVADGHMSRRKVVGVLRDAFGLDISLGALSESEWIMSEAVSSAVEEVRQHAVNAEVKHIDATGWSEAGSAKTLWAIATTSVTAFSIAASGAASFLRAWLGRAHGTLVSDRATVFSFWVMERRQVCWAHLIRKFVEFIERGGRARRIGNGLLRLTRLMMLTYHRVRDGTAQHAELQHVVELVRPRIEQLLRQGTLPSARGIQGACADILDHRDALWTFANDPAVEPTNNHAERELRGIVIWRKSTAGSRSARGNEFAANLKTVIHTCRKQRRNVLGFLRATIVAALHRQPTPSLLRHAL